MRRGLFITFEGGEGAGKTTLIESLCQFFSKKKRASLKVREPGGTLLGEKVRSLLLESPLQSVDPRAELCLFLASRAQQVHEVILPSLHRGEVVLCDRFHDSSIAYQGYGRGLDQGKIKEICDFIAGGLEPDLTFYLDLDPDVGLRRASRDRAQDRMESEALSFHEKVRQGYLNIAKEEKRFHLIDAKASKEEVYSQVLEIVEKHV